jgi:hypothetical protein
VRELLVFHYGRQISTRDLFNTMSCHATGYVRERGIAESVELQPAKRCECVCRDDLGLEVCPSMVPKYPTSLVVRPSCSCGGCRRGWKSPDSCRWLDWSTPAMTIIG